MEFRTLELSSIICKPSLFVVIVCGSEKHVLTVVVAHDTLSKIQINLTNQNL
jgi:hypothetical protein